MSNRKTLALSLTLFGLILAIAGPFLPGGVHLVANSPPGAGHITDLIATDTGDVLAGTQSGKIWRFRDGVWIQTRLNLDGHPVMAMLGDPERTPVGTAAGLYGGPPGAPPLEGRISSLLQQGRTLLAGTPRGVRLLVDSVWRAPGPEANVYTLLKQTRNGQQWLHAGTIGAGVLSTPASDPSAVWQPNNAGLPEDVKVFSLATSRAGLLLAGTDQGLFWQSRPGQSWHPLDPALAGKRILSMHLDAESEQPGSERLWIGTDDGLYWLAIAEQGDGLTAQGGPQPADSTAYQPSLGISWIVSRQGHLMLSAGTVYQYGPTKLAGWYWVSLTGVLLILIAGWLMPRPEERPSEESAR